MKVDLSPLATYWRDSRRYIAVLVLIGAVTVSVLPIRSSLNVVDVLLIYLASVTATSLLFELKPSIVAAVIAFLAFNFFYTVPYYTFSVENHSDIVALFAFLGLAILVAQLVGRVKARTMEAIRRGRQTDTLYRLSVALIRESNVQSVQLAIVDRLRAVFDLSSSAIVARGDDDRFEVAAFAGDNLDFLDRGMLSLARWSLRHNQQASIGSPRVKVRSRDAMKETHLDSRYEILFIPIRTIGTEDRVLLVARERGQRPFDDEESQMLETFTNQAALAIERTVLVEEHTRAEILARTDELKTALLSAVSHDLRTPLASIKASATALLQPDFAWSDEDGRALLQTIDEEADRLNRLVTNLLDLSRIEAGELKPTLDWYEASTLVGYALDRCQPLLSNHRVSVEVPDDEAMIEVDFVMISEVLSNLIENAAKYSPAGTTITISAHRLDRRMEFSVRDEGSGIPPGEESRIFDKFYRVEAKYRPTGSGMGLAISRGFVEAHGGRISVHRNQERGSTFRFTVSLTPKEFPYPGESEARQVVRGQ